MKTFKDLQFIPHSIEGIQAKEFFNNGYGISVVKSSFSYGGNEGFYECAVLKGNKYSFRICYTTPITDDVIGWCTPEKVTEIMKQIQEL